MTLAIAALAGFLLLQVAIGVWISRRIATEDDYLVGGRRFGYTLATFSIFATWFGAESVIGSAGEVYSSGVSIATAEPYGYGLCLILMGAFLARPLWNRGLTTLADLYRQRFGAGVERLAAIILIPTSVLWAAAQVRAFGSVIALVGDIDLSLGLGIAAVFTIAYTTFGGLLADAVTDVLQGAVLSIGLIATLVLVVQHVGGFGDAMTIIRTSEAINFAPSAAGAWYETLEAWAIPVCGSLVATEIIGRVIAARSGTVAQRSSIGAGMIYLTIGSIPVVIALLARSFVGDLANAEQVLPTVASTVLPPLAFAIFTGGLVSAILSTVDSTLLVASGLLSHNILIPLTGVTDDRRKVLLARAGVIGFGALAYLLAANAEGVLALVEQASAFGSAGILVTTLFALFTKLGSARTAAATLILALAVYLGATALGSPVPFLASLGAALLTWTIGCVRDA
jgi:SSS family solute:Na+ symporter